MLRQWCLSKVYAQPNMIEIHDLIVNQHGLHFSRQTNAAHPHGNELTEVSRKASADVIKNVILMAATSVRVVFCLLLVADQAVKRWSDFVHLPSLRILIVDDLTKSVCGLLLCIFCKLSLDNNRYHFTFTTLFCGCSLLREHHIAHASRCYLMLDWQVMFTPYSDYQTSFYTYLPGLFLYRKGTHIMVDPLP